MPLNPPNTPFEALNVWLKTFCNETVPSIIRGNHVGFETELCVKKTIINTTALANIGIRDIEEASGPACGVYTKSGFWLGFYYNLFSNNHVRGPVQAFLGCQYDFIEFTIDIMVEGGRNPLYQALDPPQLPFSRQPSEVHLIRCKFADYMRMQDKNFDFADWLRTSKTQEDDLRNFFETINSQHLVPKIP